MKYEIEEEADGRWIAEAPSMPGVMAYGATPQQALDACIMLRSRVESATPMPGPALTSPIDEHLYRDRADKYEAALMKINAIRNSIIGTQGFNFSEHAYPLVAALDEAGMVGAPYPEARANVGTLIERATQAEAETARLSSILRHLGGILGNEDPQTMHYAASRAVGDAEAWKARAERHATDLRAALDAKEAAPGSGTAVPDWMANLSDEERSRLTAANNPTTLGDETWTGVVVPKNGGSPSTKDRAARRAFVTRERDALRKALTDFVKATVNAKLPQAAYLARGAAVLVLRGAVPFTRAAGSKGDDGT